MMQIEKLHDSGERAGLATAVMEHATAMVNLASALYVCKKLVEAKVGARGNGTHPFVLEGGWGFTLSVPSADQPPRVHLVCWPHAHLSPSPCFVIRFPLCGAKLLLPLLRIKSPPSPSS